MQSGGQRRIEPRCPQVIKNELQIYLNYEKSCREFHNYVLTEPKLLSATASGEKYYWRGKSATCTTASASSASGTAVTPTNERQ